MRRAFGVGLLVLAACGSGHPSSSSSGSGSASSATHGVSASATATLASSSAASSGSGGSSGATHQATSTATASSGSASTGTSTASSFTASTGSSGSTATATSSASSATATSSSSGGSSGCGADGTACTYTDGSAGTCCGGICQYDLDQNAEYCGSCTNACPAEDFCYGGQCFAYTCSDSNLCFTADGGQGACCGTDALTCVDSLTDDTNCGECGHTCGAGQTCASGSCLATDCTVLTNADQGCIANGVEGTCCDGVCAPYSSCLGCGELCPSGASCGTDDYCTTADGGYAYCSLAGGLTCPNGTTCATDGRCVVEASACGPSTLGSVCAGSSGNGLCCGTSCADPSTDDSNCGSCGAACGAGTWCYEAQCTPIPQCDLGDTGTACPTDAGPGLCCSGACINPRTDDANCGACGATCPLDQTCGSLTGYGSACLGADGGYGGCGEGAPCPAGTVCLANACYALTCAPGQTGGSCAFGVTSDGSSTGTCCNGACVDLDQSPANCGACGTTCASGICAGDFPFDLAQCTPNLNDAGPVDAGPFWDNCMFAGCGDPSLTCVNGQCISATCQVGGFNQICQAGDGVLGSCCSDLFTNTATCHDLSGESDNCGGCGWTCPSGSTCVVGACTGVTAACGPGHHGEYCDLDAGPSSLCCADGCTDTRTDPDNCGSCGYACGGGLSCVGGTCLALTCTASTQEQYCAEADGGTGACCSTACVDLDTDPANCGDCAHRCAGSTTCEAGGCGLDACTEATTGDPCHLPAGYLGTCCSSTCVDTTSDAENCGGCGLTCSADAGCSNSGCG